MAHRPGFDRRTLLGALAATGAAALLPGRAAAQAEPAAPLARPIPSSGEALPVVGLGSWITFNVGEDPRARAACAEVMRAFLEGGGRMIDSSPMYGSAQAVIGDGLARIGGAERAFSADKVWTSSNGPAQVEASRGLWRIPRFDLLQVHNLLAWEAHLPMLEAMKADGRLRYVGITTSEGRRHDEFARIMGSRPLDFVQLTYNPADREAEARLLPLAQDRGMAVIVNRPFRQGPLVRRLQRHPPPDWAAEIGCTGWPQIVLKFILSHPAVGCVIPATTQVAHVRENLGAAREPMPDAAMRRRIVAEVERRL